MAIRKPSVRRHTAKKDVELDLSPILSVICILVPMLLLTASFVSITTIEVAAPKYVDMGIVDDSVTDPTKTPLYLTLGISDKGYYLSQEKDAQPDSALFIPRAVCADNASSCYADHELYNHLVKIKQTYPDEHVLHVSADADMDWEHVAHAMDVARNRLKDDSYDTLDEFQHALPGAEPLSPLFPHVIFTLIQ